MLYEKDLTDKIIGAALEVHRTLGPGLLESAYAVCLAHELMLRDVPFEKEKPLTGSLQGCAVGLRLSRSIFWSMARSLSSCKVCR